MVKVTISYPIVHFDTIVTEMSQEQFEDLQNASDEERADFIDKLVKDKKPYQTTWDDLIEKALDVGFAYIKKS